MSSAGHIIDMLKRQDANRALRSSNRKSKFLSFPESSTSQPKNFKELKRSPEELLEFRKELSRQKIQQEVKIWIGTAILSTLIISSFLFLFYWLVIL